MQDLSSRIEKYSHYEPTTGCVLFSGSGVKGYGRLKINGKSMLVHRLVYFAYHSVPYNEYGLILHKCDTRACINPQHLYMGDHRDNGLDTRNRDRHPLYFKEACVHGHIMDISNIYLYRGARHCKRCRSIRVAAFNKRRRDVKNSSGINART